MMHLSSVSSKAAGLHEYILSHKAEDETLKNARFAQGDIVTTVITCAGGETIVLTLDTTLPRYYSRNFTVRGTKGMYEEATDSCILGQGRGYLPMILTGVKNVMGMQNNMRKLMIILCGRNIWKEVSREPMTVWTGWNFGPSLKH